MDAQFLISAFRQHQYPVPDKPEIAIAGRSNVGKSSLINALVNRRKLARTGSQPGRTQSINFFVLNGVIYLVDLPGYGYAKVPLQVKASWKQMVETYLGTRPNLKAVVVILDIRRDLAAGDRDLLDWLMQHGVEIILAMTKVDKISRQQAGIRAKRICQGIETGSVAGPILFSSRTGQGRDELRACINRIAGVMI